MTVVIHELPKSLGWSTVPCPGCGELIQPGEKSLIVSGEWLPWHPHCYESPSCPICEGRHPLPHDGSCLI